MREAGGDDREGHIAGFGYFLGAGDDGGASGDDVVYQQDMLACHKVGAQEPEGVLYIFYSFRELHLCLAFMEMNSFHSVRDNGNTRHFADAVGDEFALIVFALHPSSPCDRYGNDDIDIVEEVCCGEVFCHQFSEGHADAWLVVIFEVVDGSAYLMVRGVEEKGSGFLYRDESPE